MRIGIFLQLYWLNSDIRIATDNYVFVFSPFRWRMRSNTGSVKLGPFAVIDLNRCEDSDFS